MKLLNKIQKKITRIYCRIVGHRPAGMLEFNVNHISCECDRCGEILSVKIKKEEGCEDDNNL